jgi:predicted methyltransferase
MPVRVSFPIVLMILAGIAQAGEIDAKVEAALAAESRPEAHVERDRNRRPLETLKFLGLEDDMTVLELLPGGGWYTRVLAPVLASAGRKAAVTTRSMTSRSASPASTWYLRSGTFITSTQSPATASTAPCSMC